MSQAAVSVRSPRRWLRWAAPVVIGIVAIVLLRDRLPHWSDVIVAAREAKPWWLVLAAVAEIGSLSMFARQQRRLLRAFGVQISLPRAMAISLSRSAIAISMPAGTAISAAFAFQQFRARGASRGVATAVMILSGVVSFLGLGLLYLVGGTVSGLVSGCALLLVAAVTIGLVAVIWRGSWRPKPDGRLGRMVEAARGVAPKHWALALSFAVVNWLADLICLLAVVRAFNLPLPLTAIAGTYLAVQVVRQIPLTPGGIGLIETGLVAGLVSAGASDAPATAAVLGYRVLSCWLIIPFGMFAWTMLRRSPAVAEAATPTPTLVEAPA
ncbi:uncharacterized membrane protein YbhN (UPF0104 family) [Allocatelliglobosispora scoriae]|uniref:Uncharacterized membrane protein YbhN (UPF0104 family) n=1 Tax=Allocatelliglobosispora scoriae TaxID=643052 RepID=A0A841BNA5_9ACTN|nr:lysylphosphatidylglycerol synthase transmembrane domain-containing protein [Allocatelliglobosispora scoriae]MBB5868311.1 uncharacterized membrane protein YbhN (UPF0104 family) [Allocatelliglobosispora scoriae]